MDYASQCYYLNAMGLPQWVLKEQADGAKTTQSLVPSGLLAVHERGRSQVDSAPFIANKNTPQFDSDPLAEEQTNLLPEPKPKKHSANTIKAPDYHEWGRSQIDPAPFIDNRDTHQFDSAPLITSLAKQISACQLCKQRLYGEQSLKIQLLRRANKTSKTILLMVAMPSLSEYQQGAYLSAQYQDLLEAIFQSINLDANVYISAQLKCLASQYTIFIEDESLKKEIQNCMPFLQSEISQIQPDVVVTLGSVQLNELVQENVASSTLEQQVGNLFNLSDSLIENKSISLIATFHPSFLYRNPWFKSKALKHWITISHILAT